MAIIITRVSGTVGKPVVVAVITNQEQKNFHTPLNVWVEKEFGQWATIEYLETYQIPTISLTDLNVDRILCLDELN